MPFISEDCSQAYKFAAQGERGRYNSPKLNDFQIWGILHNIHREAAIRDVADTADTRSSPASADQASLNSWRPYPRHFWTINLMPTSSTSTTTLPTSRTSWITDPWRHMWKDTSFPAGKTTCLLMRCRCAQRLRRPLTACKPEREALYPSVEQHFRRADIQARSVPPTCDTGRISEDDYFPHIPARIPV